MKQQQELAGNTVVLILRLTPLYGILVLLLAFPLYDIRVETVQPNGLPEISYPLWGLAIILQLLGVGLLVFGALFNFSPIESMGVRIAVSSSASVGTGSALMVLSVFGILGNYSELGLHGCTGFQGYPVCGSIFWLLVEFSLLASLGVALFVVGFIVRSKNMRLPAPPSNLSSHQNTVRNEPVTDVRQP